MLPLETRLPTVHAPRVQAPLIDTVPEQLRSPASSWGLTLTLSAPTANFETPAIETCTPLLVLYQSPDAVWLMPPKESAG